MMKVSSTVKMNFGRIRELTKAQVTALGADSGVSSYRSNSSSGSTKDGWTASGEGFFVDYSDASQGKVSLVHNTPYARRMYYHPEYNFHKEPWVDDKGREHDGNPNAQGEWYKDWLLGGIKENDCKEAFKQSYKRITGV